MADPVQTERTVVHAWGEVLRRYRLWKRMSRREVADRGGISVVFLGEIERGEKDASSHTLCSIADALGVPLSELYLRVAMRLHARGGSVGEQNALPLIAREAEGAYLDGVPLSKDETAFDLYRIVRLLPSEQQVSLLVLARALLPEDVAPPVEAFPPP